MATEERNQIVIPVKVQTDTQQLDEIISKAEQLSAVLKEAKSLADDLASQTANISIQIECLNQD